VGGGSAFATSVVREGGLDLASFTSLRGDAEMPRFTVDEAAAFPLAAGAFFSCAALDSPFGSLERAASNFGGGKVVSPTAAPGDRAVRPPSATFSAGPLDAAVLEPAGFEFAEPSAVEPESATRGAVVVAASTFAGGLVIAADLGARCRDRK
jgi:hypothetical protein